MCPVCVCFDEKFICFKPSQNALVLPWIFCSLSPPKIKMNMLSVISIFGAEKITTQKAIYSTHSIWLKFVQTLCAPSQSAEYTNALLWQTDACVQLTGSVYLPLSCFKWTGFSTEGLQKGESHLNQNLSSHTLPQSQKTKKKKIKLQFA